MTTKDMMTWIILIITTALMQIETIRIKGHLIFGGNVVFPFLMALLLWYVPSRIRDFKGLVKGEIFLKEDYGIQRNKL